MIGLRITNISPFCVLDTSMCFPNPCLNGGQCAPVVNYYMCTCRHGYGGQRCDNREFSCISCRTTKRVFQQRFKTDVFILVFFISDLILLRLHGESLLKLKFILFKYNVQCSNSIFKWIGSYSYNLQLLTVLIQVGYVHRWSGTLCRTTSAHSRTMSPLDRVWKTGFSPDTSVFSALETFVIIALYKSTFTIPYHTIDWSLTTRDCEMRTLNTYGETKRSV